MKTYKVIAKRVSYEELVIKADSESDVIELITMGNTEYEWDGGTDGYADNSILSSEEVTT